MVKPDGINWKLWERDEYPNWSLPALEAAKCAAMQSPEAADDLHFRLFRGFFEEGVNISNPEELLALVQQAPLDFERFLADFTSGQARQAVMADYNAAVTTHLVDAIPTVIFNDEAPIVGAVPIEAYVKTLEKLGVV